MALILPTLCSEKSIERTLFSRTTFGNRVKFLTKEYMKIKRIHVWPAAKVSGLLYLCVGGVFSLLGVPVILFSPHYSPAEAWTLGILFLLGFPVLLAVFGFLAGTLGASLYNVIATHMGGFEIDVE